MNLHFILFDGRQSMEQITTQIRRQIQDETLAEENNCLVYVQFAVIITFQR